MLRLMMIVIKTGALWNFIQQGGLEEAPAGLGPTFSRDVGVITHLLQKHPTQSQLQSSHTATPECIDYGIRVTICCKDMLS